MQRDPDVSDERLRETIMAALAVDSRTAHVELRVGVLNGIVHLAGAADTLAERSAAEALAGQAPGVRGVVNRIAAPGAPSPMREINLDLKTSQ
jgi:osmotically-inducible protein OsmY